MFIGHYAPALIAAASPKAPRLGTLFVAAQLVDIAFFSFVLTGTEAMRITPGFTAMNNMDLFHMPYTHSLLGAVAFGLVAALVVYVLARRAGEGNGNTIVVWPVAGAIITGLVVVSHWFIDWLVHVPDLTLAGSPPKYGLGLWNHPAIAMPLELALVGGALAWYWLRTSPREGAGNRWLIALVAAMLIIQAYNWLAPQPTEMGLGMPLSALFAYGLFAWLAMKAGSERVPNA